MVSDNVKKAIELKAKCDEIMIKTMEINNKNLSKESIQLLKEKSKVFSDMSQTLGNFTSSDRKEYQTYLKIGVNNGQGSNIS